MTFEAPDCEIVLMRVMLDFALFALTRLLNVTSMSDEYKTANVDSAFNLKILTSLTNSNAALILCRYH